MQATISTENNKINLHGAWNLSGIEKLNLDLHSFQSLPDNIIIDGQEISSMDTAGAWKLYYLINTLETSGKKTQLDNFNTEQNHLIDIVKKNEVKLGEITPSKKPSFFSYVGKETIASLTFLQEWFYFVGEVFMTLLNVVMNPLRFRWKYFLNILEINGYRALPIIGFLTFLIGVVITYQIGLELKYYGANIFIIDLLGLSIMREFAPLITAIIITGRTGSAFTAQLGLMKVNEEVDALRTMGHSPIELLVVPRIIGLVIAMPLLCVWADIFGLMGGMMMSKSILGIGYIDFLTRFPQEITITTFMIGLIKAPVFALIIAMVGCFHGLRVSGSSESLGLETTKSVVMAIFLIIIADSIFSVVLSKLNI